MTAGWDSRARDGRGGGGAGAGQGGAGWKQTLGLRLPRERLPLLRSERRGASKAAAAAAVGTAAAAEAAAEAATPVSVGRTRLGRGREREWGPAGKGTVGAQGPPGLGAWWSGATMALLA